jgi:hypothetical protein
MFSRLFRKVKRLMEPERNLSATDVAARTASWNPESFFPLYAALGLDPAETLRIGLIGISPTQFADAMQRVRRGFQQMALGGGTDAAMAAMARDRDAPATRSVPELIGLAREWARRSPPESPLRFLPTVSADLAALPPDDQEWIANGLRAIAARHYDDLPPRPAPPPAVDPDTLNDKLRQNREFLIANRRRLAENIEAGRGLCDAPEPEAAGAGK